MPSGDNHKKLKSATDVIAPLIKHGGNVSETARELGVTAPTVRYHRDKLIADGHDLPKPGWYPATGQKKHDSHAHRKRVEEAAKAGWIDEEAVKPLTGGRIDPREIVKRPMPKGRSVSTYILTGATNNTDVHAGLWANLQALAAHYDAEIMVRRITYNLNAWRRLGADSELEGEVEGEVYYDPAIRPHICEDRVQLAPGLQWAGDAPITATAVSPLSRYDTFTAESSGIFAATKIEMKSVATMRGQPSKLLGHYALYIPATRR